MRKILTLLVLASSVLLLEAQNPNDSKQSVMIQAEVQETPPQIRLRWFRDTLNGGYTVYRKAKNATVWGTPLGTALAGDTTFTDNNVVPGQTYEYRVSKNLAAFGGGISSGYLYAGIKAKPIHFHGACILVVDSTFKAGLASEIARLQQDIEEDGWRVHTLYVDRNDPVTKVRAAIKATAQADGAPFRSVFLLGHVPVPYSGFVAPDGHVPDHQGAWPCDGYYADLDGVWTDINVNVITADDPRNDNVPGDGKFDQSSFPTALELAVGRVDFANMPAFPQSELELLRRYLNKNHAWRKGMMPAEERGLVQNNFASFAEGFGQNGWKNFTPMFGKQQVTEVSYRNTLLTDSYLWSYGCGAGSYTSVGGITTTTNFVTDSLRTVFTMLFGSYFGDWDRPNNLLRASIASGSTLTNAWAARPNWMFHHMALGEPIGHSARLSMNNNGALYQSGFAPQGIHMGLMGDPTLRMHAMRPPASLVVTQDGLDARLSWDPVEGAEGYFVYRRVPGSDQFALLTPDPITAMDYVDACIPAGAIGYQVRATRLKATASGSFQMLGSAAGIVLDADPEPFQAKSSFLAVPYFDELSLANTSQNATAYLWDLGDGTVSQEQSVVHLYQQPGTYTVCLKAFDACAEDTSCQQVTVINSLPEVVPSILDVSCFGDTDGAIQLDLIGGTPSQTVVWSDGAQGPQRLDLAPGDYSGVITSATGRTLSFGPLTVGSPDSLDLAAQATPASGGMANGTASISVDGGTPPYAYAWSNGSTAPVNPGLLPGVYCVTVTDGNGCTAVACAQVQQSSATTPLPGLTSWNLTPNPAGDFSRLELGFASMRRVEVSLLDGSGRAMEQVIVEGASPVHTFRMAGLPSGTYWILLTSGTDRMALPLSKP